MRSNTMEVKLIHPDAKIPFRATQGAAGLDLYSVEDCTIWANGRPVLIPTGVCLAIPRGMVGLIWPRSGLAVNYAVDRLAGVIDSDYRGEVKVSLICHGEDSVSIKKGDRIAQLIIQEYMPVRMAIVDVLDETDRGAGGFGHTGE